MPLVSLSLTFSHDKAYRQLFLANKITYNSNVLYIVSGLEIQSKLAVCECFVYFIHLRLVLPPEVGLHSLRLFLFCIKKAQRKQKADLAIYISSIGSGDRYNYRGEITGLISVAFLLLFQAR